MFSKIYLDLDDVLVDFSGAVCKLWGACPLKVGETRKDRWEVDGWGIEGLTSESLQHRIDEVGSRFWVGLEDLPWYDELIDRCCRIADNVSILTCPSTFASSLDGKRTWYEWSGLHQDGIDLVIDSDKSRYAGEGILLIDDRVSHCQQFKANGGEAWLFPAFGNPLYNLRLEMLEGNFTIRNWYRLCNSISLT